MCPHCGAPQARVAPPTTSEARLPWVAWTALPFSLLAALSAFKDASWDRDAFVGACASGAIGATLAVISLTQRRPDKPIAIVALVAGLLGALVALDALN